MKATLKRQAASAIYILCGALAAGLGIKGFLLPSGFIDGGVTGISMLLARLTHAPLAVIILLVNLPFIGVGLKLIGKRFAILSTLAILALALALAAIPYPAVTEDKLLDAVFGGFFVGAGIGLAIRGGGVLDGTEVLALIVSRRTFATVGDVIFALNVVIFSVAAFFLGIETALYSMLTYFAASKTIDFLLHGVEEYNGAMIISAHSERIRRHILVELERGVTVLKGQGGFTEHQRDVLFCVVTRLEITRLKTLVTSIDYNAFIVLLPVNETSGGMIKRRAYH